MASRFWVLGTGTWDGTTTTHWSATTGGAGGASVPTSVDDVFFDANSGGGTVTPSITQNVHNFSSAGFTGTFGAGIVNCNSASAITLGSAATHTSLTIGVVGAGTCTFTSNSRNIGTLSVTTGVLSQADAMNVANTFLVTSGTWQTNNFAASMATFSSSNTNTRTFTLGSSAITVSGAGSSFAVTPTNLTITTNTAIITMTGGGTTWSGGGTNWNGTSVVINGSGTCSMGAANTIANLSRIGTAAKTEELVFNGTTTITGTLTINSNSIVNRIFLRSSVASSTRVLNAGVISITNGADFQDITAGGAANWNLSAITGGSGDAGGNTGITFTTSATQTWLPAYNSSYLQLPGIVGNYTTTSDTAALSITGDIDLRCRVAMNAWVPSAAGNVVLLSKFNPTGNQRSYALILTASTGLLNFTMSVDGTNVLGTSSSVAPTISNGQTLWVRATRAKTSGTVTFYTASGSLISPAAGDWTQLGTTGTLSAGSVIFDSTADVEVGASAVGTTSAHILAAGKFYRAQIYNGIAGTLAFDADFTTRTAGTATFSENSTNAATVTLQAATGTWSTAAQWSGRIPLAQDDVVISSAFSASQTINIDMPRMGRSIDFTGTTGSPAITPLANLGAINFFGNFTLASFATGKIGTASGTNVQASGRGSFTITSNGQGIGPSFVMTAPGGTYSQADDMSFPNNSFVLTAGTWNTNNHALTWPSGVTGGQFSVAAGVTVNYGTSIVTLGNAAAATPFSMSASATIDAGSATFIIENATTNTRIFAGGGKTYGTLTYTVANSTGILSITSPNTFGTINIGSGRTLLFPAGGVTTITNWNVVGQKYGYLFLADGLTNVVEAPYISAYDITGDIEIEVDFTPQEWFPTASRSIMGRDDGSTKRHFYLRSLSNTTLQFALFTGVMSSWTFTWNPTIGVRTRFKITRTAATGSASLYTWTGTAWSLVQTVAGTSGASSAVTQQMTIGGMAGNSVSMAAYFYRATVRNGIGGTAVFDADFTTKPFGVNTFIESSVNAATVTITGTIARVGDGRIAVGSSTPGSQITLTGVGNMTSDYIFAQDVLATGGARWLAGEHSINNGNNSGIQFVGPRRQAGGLRMMV